MLTLFFCRIGALSGANSAGAVLGCLTSAWAADAISRKRTIMLGCAILIVGGALCAGSISIGMVSKPECMAHVSDCDAD